MPSTVLRAGDTAETRWAWFQLRWETFTHINPIILQIYNYKLCLSAMVEMNKGLGGKGIGQLHLCGELKMS